MSLIDEIKTEIHREMKSYQSEADYATGEEREYFFGAVRGLELAAEIVEDYRKEVES